ncbi:MAG: iron-containing alcohol dehydrogenase [Oscillospiraceae bacterium]|nr:iron-containing alcohol dehydrogenase [Oscillospiraceae bacterium]
MIKSYAGWPGKVVAGEGALAAISEEVKALKGSRVAVFSDGFVSTLPLVTQAMDNMKAIGLEVMMFNRIGPNPTDAMVMDGVEEMKAFKPDVLVCVGGGSPMDCAKAANVVYTHGGEVEDYNVNTGGVMRIENKLLPFIAVPTTAGTGSEVTNVGVITGLKRHIKFGVLSPYLVPTVAVLDPLITVGLNPSITAATGIDALTHCIESYVSVDDFPIANAEALYGIKMIKKNLPIVYADGSNVEARENMLLAAMMAGASFNINNLGLCHQMAHQLSAYFGMAHGVANAVLLPEVMRFNMRAVPERYADIAEAFGVDIRGMSVEEAAKAGIEAVEQFCRDMGIPKYLDELGVEKEKVPAMAITALEDGVGATNPIQTTIQECEEVFYKCFSK